MKQRGEAVFSFFKDKERKEFSSVEAVDEIEKIGICLSEAPGLQEVRQDAAPLC